MLISQVTILWYRVRFYEGHSEVIDTPLGVLDT